MRRLLTKLRARWGNQRSSREGVPKQRTVTDSVIQYNLILMHGTGFYIYVGNIEFLELKLEVN